ncbi:MAG: hypothetical protein DRJ66_00445 [Thermoprotei archaeon]|nr:MAG: hypothetical protein DRJ66_00445 [Thermoprotei archaeon]RLF20405.1 MAG: hypothetical protein DRZ82_02475 [Thermoprotei archaeon]
MARIRISGFIKRYVSIRYDTEEEMIELVERISDRLDYIDFKLDVRSKNLRVTLYGPKDLVKEALADIGEIVRGVKGMLYPDIRGLYSYSVRDVMSLIRGVAIPLNILVYALRLRGYRALIEDGCIRTDASLEEVASLAAGISDAYEEMKYLDMTPTCKRLVALYAALKDISIGEAIDDLESMKLIKKENERYMLAREFNQSLKLLEDYMSSGEDHED